METLQFTIIISKAVPSDERDELLLVLRPQVELIEPAPRDLGAAWDVFVAVMRDVTAVVGAATAVIKLGETINDWRKKVRERGSTPQGRLERPGRSPLDLDIATDEEVHEWLHVSPQENKNRTSRSEE